MKLTLCLVVSAFASISAFADMRIDQRQIDVVRCQPNGVCTLQVSVLATTDSDELVDVTASMVSPECNTSLFINHDPSRVVKNRRQEMDLPVDLYTSMPTRLRFSLTYYYRFNAKCDLLTQPPMISLTFNSRASHNQRTAYFLMGKLEDLRIK